MCQILYYDCLNFSGIVVGDRVRVQLIGTDVERGFIDFSGLGRTAPTRAELCFPGNDTQQLLWIGSPFLWFKKKVISCLPVMKFRLF